MRRIASGALVLVALSARMSFAGEAACKEGACPTGAKISKLLSSWKTTLDEAKLMCPDERAKLETRFASVAKECPLGSRMGETIGFVKSALGTALASQEACSKTCPVAAAKTGEAAQAEAPACEGSKLAAARARLLGDLHQLASYVSGAGGSGACEKACEGKGAVEASVKKDFCAEKAAKIAAAVKAEACDEAAAALVIKGIEGLECKAKAGEIVAAVRAEACEKGAAAIVAKAATEVLASVKKDGAAASTARKDFCAEKAAKIAAAVKAEACDEAAAALVIKGIEGLECKAKAGEIVAAVRAEACEKGAAAIVARAATEVLASVKKDSAVKTASGTQACAEACAKEGTSCCQEVASRVTALKASWGKVGAELAAMCPQKKKELMATFQALSRESKIPALLPESVLALAEGVDALEAVNAKMVEWAKANPEVLKSVPEDARKAFERDNALIHEAGEVLRAVRAGMMAARGPEAKTETAAKS